MENKFFIHQIKKTNDLIEKGIVVKDSFESAKQGYHAYLGAYAYGQNPETNFVSCMISDMSGSILMSETWVKSEPETNE